MAKLVPVTPRQPADIFGAVRGTVRIPGDIVSPDPASRGELA